MLLFRAIPTTSHEILPQKEITDVANQEFILVSKSSAETLGKYFPIRGTRESKQESKVIP